MTYSVYGYFLLIEKRKPWWGASRLASWEDGSHPALAREQLPRQLWFPDWLLGDFSRSLVTSCNAITAGGLSWNCRKRRIFSALVIPEPPDWRKWLALTEWNHAAAEKRLRLDMETKAECLGDKFLIRNDAIVSTSNRMVMGRFSYKTKLTRVRCLYAALATNAAYAQIARSSTQADLVTFLMPEYFLSLILTLKWYRLEVVSAKCVGLRRTDFFATLRPPLEQNNLNK